MSCSWTPLRYRTNSFEYRYNHFHTVVKVHEPEEENEKKL